MFYYSIISKVDLNSHKIFVTEYSGKQSCFIIKEPWLVFLPYLTRYDIVYIHTENNFIDEKGFLVINPQFLIAVTRTLDAITCPRKVYVKKNGGEEKQNKAGRRRITEGNLLHSLFSHKITKNDKIDNLIELTIKESKSDLILADIDELQMKTYLSRDAEHLKNFNIEGQSEIDAQSWKFGLHGKFDGITDKQILELKTSKIPNMPYPWPDHNLQMRTYLSMMEPIGDYNGMVIYLKNGNIAIKKPSDWNHGKTIIARNYAYLVYSGKLVPNLLRNDEMRECNNCFVKEGCYSLCAGLKTQRDCENCFHNSYCPKTEWRETDVAYLNNFSDALDAEVEEFYSNDFYFASSIAGNEEQRKSIIEQGLGIETINIEHEVYKKGNYITNFKIKSNLPRFRKGDFVRAYSLDETNTSTTLYHSVIVDKINDNYVIIISPNKLTNRMLIIPSNVSNLLNRIRRGLYRIVKLDSKIGKIIKDSHNISFSLKNIEIKEKELLNPLKNYNKTQVNAILSALNTPDILLLQGPAGTGKTTVIVEIINQLYLRGKSILCSAYTNMAIDNIGILLKNNKIPFLRLGNPYSIDSEIKEFNIINNEEFFRRIINKETNAVILGTTSTLSKQLYEDLFFNYVIIDEAAQMTEPDCLQPILMTNRLILVGDHAQLQPIVTSQEALKRNLHISLFERLVNDIPNRHILLNLQYRMNDEILSFPNKIFYSGQLKSASELIGKQNYPSLKGILLNQSPYQIICITYGIKQLNLVNKLEAMVILNVIEDIFSSLPDLDKKDIGIVTPFRAQVAYLRNIMPEVQIDTIDRYQGSEKEIIILSTVTSENIPILSDPRRVNVALTRAKKKMIVIMTNPKQSRTNWIINSIYLDGIRRKLVYHVNINEINLICDEIFKKISSEKIIEETNQILEDLKIQRKENEHQIEIYYNSTILPRKNNKNSKICFICNKPVKKSIICLGCQNSFHEVELIEHVKELGYCPICKHSLILNDLINE